MLYGLDTVSLAVVAPMAAVAGLLSLRGRSLGALPGFGPAAYAIYMVPQYVLGPDYSHLAGNNERWFPLLLIIFGLGCSARCSRGASWLRASRADRRGSSRWSASGCRRPVPPSSSSVRPDAGRLDERKPEGHGLHRGAELQLDDRAP